ncbi:MAG: type II toxin-antitoxin system ParD family antitoxin [Maricaulaceae bacterium]|nr:type II toxin-antitoxin system ParD family antitoxin [Maricaulaceae bacterium]
MNVSLTRKFEDFIEAAIATGRYKSASEVVREALRLLEEREAKLEALRRDIQIGLDSGIAGEFDEAALARMKERIRKRATEMRGE